MPAEDQVSKLRRLMDEVHCARTIAVVSGKGGVGKSNIALNLAILLSAAQKRVALVDADMGLANLDVLADVTVRANLGHVIAGSRTLEEIIVYLPGGVQFIPGASGLARLARLSEFQRAGLIQQLDTLDADNDIVVIDCGAGIGPDVVNLAAGADNILIVTTPELTAVTDAYAVIKVLDRREYSGQMSLLVNFAPSRQDARETYQRLAGVARQFLGVRLFDAGYVLTDPKVPQAVQRREPFVMAYPRCPASRCVAALATKLASQAGRTAGKEGFFKRVANWFA